MKVTTRTSIASLGLMVSVVALAGGCGPGAEEASAVQLAINEVMPRNDTTLSDSAGENDDWLEIANLGDSEVALDGFTLGDSGSTGTFPDGAVIPVGGFLVVFADDSVSGTPEEPHFPFKLSGSGESVELRDASGSVIDGFDVPPLDVDISFGRMPDGTGEPQEVAPTPGRANGAR